MNTLRVLVVNSDPQGAERWAEWLASAHHSALPATGLEEASEALFVQRFDAVLLSSPLPLEGIAEFTAKLRTLEKSQRAAVPAPVLSFSSEVPNGADWCAGEQGIDAYLAESFQPSVLCEAVNSLAASLARGDGGEACSQAEGTDLNVEEFRAQVGHDDGLMTEIIELFLGESPQQLIEMCEALEAGDFERLSRVAHTIKGSFATLHAGRARSHAQELESAAKGREAVQCSQILVALEHDLEMLAPQLAALRDASLQPRS
jgi:HPt (histidine-containing phosphotransfer) domain-containing protein/CheY-like chemotaxis protein